MEYKWVFFQTNSPLLVDPGESLIGEPSTGSGHPLRVIESMSITDNQGWVKTRKTEEPVALGGGFEKKTEKWICKKKVTCYHVRVIGWHWNLFGGILEQMWDEEWADNPRRTGENGGQLRLHFFHRTRRARDEKSTNTSWTSMDDETAEKGATFARLIWRNCEHSCWR